MNGWKAALLAAAIIVLAACGVWWFSQAAWIDSIGMPVWIALYLLSILYWVLYIVDTYRKRRGETFGVWFRRWMLILGIITVLTYVLQIAYNL